MPSSESLRVTRSLLPPRTLMAVASQTLQSGRQCNANRMHAAGIVHVEVLKVAARSCSACRVVRSTPPSPTSEAWQTKLAEKLEEIFEEELEELRVLREEVCPATI